MSFFSQKYVDQLFLKSKRWRFHTLEANYFITTQKKLLDGWSITWESHCIENIKTTHKCECKMTMLVIKQKLKFYGVRLKESHFSTLKGEPPLFPECGQKMRFSGHFSQNFKCFHLCEFWRYEYIVNTKKIQFLILYPLARAKISRAHLRARLVRAQHHVLWKVTKIHIFGVYDVARSAR